MGSTGQPAARSGRSQPPPAPTTCWPGRPTSTSNAASRPQRTRPVVIGPLIIGPVIIGPVIIALWSSGHRIARQAGDRAGAADAERGVRPAAVPTSGNTRQQRAHFSPGARSDARAPRRELRVRDDARPPPSPRCPIGPAGDCWLPLWPPATKRSDQLGPRGPSPAAVVTLAALRRGSRPSARPSAGSCQDGGDRREQACRCTLPSSDGNRASQASSAVKHSTGASQAVRQRCRWSSTVRAALAPHAVRRGRSTACPYAHRSRTPTGRTSRRCGCQDTPRSSHASATRCAHTADRARTRRCSTQRSSSGISASGSALGIPREPGQAAQQPAQRVAQPAIQLGLLLQDLRPDAQVLRDVGVHHPQAQDVGAHLVRDLLRRGDVAERLAHLAAVLVEHEAVGQHRPERRRAAGADCLQQARGLEPAAVLVAALQIQVRRPGARRASSAKAWVLPLSNHTSTMSMTCS